MLKKLKAKLPFFIKHLLKSLMNSAVEKYLIILVFVFFISLIIMQIGLVSDTIRPYLSDIEVFEGRHISEVDSLIKEGTITLELVDMSSEKDIKILVNGITISDFSTKYVDVIVTNNSVVEIDASKVKSPVRVRITSKSSNIKSNILNHEIKVESCIKVLTRIKLK